jgi:hypothetical protein
MAAFEGEPGGRIVARMKYALLSADRGEIAQTRLHAARIQLDARFKEFLAGRGTLAFLLESSHSLLEAELAIIDRPEDRQAALERHWALTWQVDMIDRARFEAGRVGIQDVMQSHYDRLEAELRLSQARATKP